jgi:hypothetical protein
MANEESARDAQKESEAFRANIEALKADAGPKWLDVYRQSQLGVAS